MPSLHLVLSMLTRTLSSLRARNLLLPKVGFTNGFMKSFRGNASNIRPQQMLMRKLLPQFASGSRESAACGVVALGEIATNDIAYNEISGRLRLRVFREVLGLDPSSIKSLPPRVASSFRDSQQLSRGWYCCRTFPSCTIFYAVAYWSGRS